MKENDSESLVQVNMRHVKLTNDSRAKCRKVADGLHGNVADAIEGGDWWIPCKNHNYTHMKSEFEKGMRKFFNLDFDIEVDDFWTNIICYDNR